MSEAWMSGTLLPNVKEVRLTTGEVVLAVGAYMWANGWLTVYPTHSHNQGRIFSPFAVLEIVFGS